MKQFGILVLLALFSTTSAFAGQTPAPKKAAKLTAARPKAAAPAPAATAAPKHPFEAYAVADALDGQILEGLNVNRRWPQASLTKLMLAVVVMDEIERGALRLSDRVAADLRGQGYRARTIAVRIPPLSWLRSLVREVGEPLTATSANLAGAPELSDPAAVTAAFRGRIELIVDAGHSPGGLPSTIVDLASAGPRILREGRIPRERIEAFLRR